MAKRNTEIRFVPTGDTRLADASLEVRDDPQTDSATLTDKNGGVVMAIGGVKKLTGRALAVRLILVSVWAAAAAALGGVQAVGGYLRPVGLGLLSASLLLCVGAIVFFAVRRIDCFWLLAAPPLPAACAFALPYGGWFACITCGLAAVALSFLAGASGMGGQTVCALLSAALCGYTVCAIPKEPLFGLPTYARALSGSVAIGALCGYAGYAAHYATQRLYGPLIWMLPALAGCLAAFNVGAALILWGISFNDFAAGWNTDSVIFAVAVASAAGMTLCAAFRLSFKTVVLCYVLPLLLLWGVVKLCAALLKKVKY